MNFNINSSISKIELGNKKPEPFAKYAETIFQCVSSGTETVQDCVEIARKALLAGLQSTDANAHIQRKIDNLGTVIEDKALELSNELTESFKNLTPEKIAQTLEQLEKKFGEIKFIGKAVQNGIGHIQKLVGTQITELTKRILDRNNFIFGASALLFVPTALLAADSLIETFKLEDGKTNESNPSHSPSTCIKTRPNHSMLPYTVRTIAVLGAVFFANILSTGITKAMVERYVSS